jgi:hypothetical protein
LIAKVFSLASAASSARAPTDSRVFVTGPTDRALDRRAGILVAPDTLVPVDADFGRSASISVARSFHCVTSRAFLFVGDRCFVAGSPLRPAVRILAGVGSSTPADPEAFTTEASRFLAKDAAFDLDCRGALVPPEELRPM